MELPVNQIVCGDCLEVMKGWPDKCVDLVLTDPPYGININRKSNNYGDATHASRKATELTWDTLPPSPEAIREIMRVSSEQIVFGANYFWECFYSSQCYIVWDKRGHLPSVPFADTEFAWTSFRRMSKKYTVINHGFIKDSKEEKSGHPCQKPLQLAVRIVADFSTPDDLILDPYCGSGTFCVAAKMLGRRYIGIDISEEYCRIARERLEAVDTGVPVKEARQGQMALFGK